MSDLPTMAPHSRCEKVIKVTLIGTAFIGVGAVLTNYVPAFHRPVEWINRHLQSGIDQCSRLPVAGNLFAKNPLLQNKDVSEFLSLNIFETVLTMSLVAALGGALGIARSSHPLTQQISAPGR